MAGVSFSMLSLGRFVCQVYLARREPSARRARRARRRGTGVCIKNSSGENQLGTSSLKNTKSGAGVEFLLPFCRAEACVKGVFLFTDTGMGAAWTRVSGARSRPARDQNRTQTRQATTEPEDDLMFGRAVLYTTTNTQRGWCIAAFVSILARVQSQICFQEGVVYRISLPKHLLNAGIALGDRCSSFRSNESAAKVAKSRLK